MRSSWCGKINVHIQGDPTGAALALKMRPRASPSGCVLQWHQVVSFGTPSTRLGERARMPCGYALATASHDTRALEAWLGHKNIQHTVRYTERPRS